MKEEENNSNNDSENSTCPRIELGIHQNSYRPKNTEKRGSKKMSKRKIFVSFDFENDRNYKYLLEAWNGNSDFEFEFDDKSTREINSWNISTIKAALTRKINEADYTIVIVGKRSK